MHEIHYCIGKCLTSKENYQEAAKQYKSFLEEYKDEAFDTSIYQAVCRLAEAYRNLGKIEKTYEVLNEYKKSNRVTHARFWYEVGKYFFRKKRYYTAIQMFKKACTENTFDLEYDETKWYEIYYPNINIGICYYHLKNKEKALEYNKIAELTNIGKDRVEKNKKLYENM